MNDCPPLSEKQQALVRLLVQNKVVFLVIGGQAVRAYLPHRQTADLDILASRSIDNARRMASAFAHFAKPPALNGMPWEYVLTRPGYRLAYPDTQINEADILTSIDGIEFGACFRKARTVKFGDISLYVPCLLDLIEMKRKSLESGCNPPVKSVHA